MFEKLKIFPILSCKWEKKEMERERGVSQEAGGSKEVLI